MLRSCPRVRLLAAGIFALLLAGCTAAQDGPIALTTGWQLQDIANDSQPGEIISQPIYAPRSWHNAVVPGTVLTSLVADGVYPDPLYGENNRPDKIPDSLCRTSYWYRTTFAVPKSHAGRRSWLRFDGINYIAEVWVNGQRAGEIRGAFSRGIFDITDFVSPGDKAAVAVKIIPPPHPGVPLEQTVSNGTGGNGGILAEDGANFLSTIGWDWIPGIRDRDMGIWQNVWLSSTGPVVIRNPFVGSDLPLPRTDSADLTIQTTLQNVTASVQSGLLVGTFDYGRFELPVSLAANETRLIKLSPTDVASLHVQNPRLWWPNTYGAQNLSTLHLSFIVRSAESDQCDLNFGIRKITYQVAGSDNLTISCNGVPIICKGGDWGMDEAMKRIPRARLEAQIHMHAQANYTMIRNWVGQSTSEDFYDLCDRYGILLWDEMFQPNPSDGPNPLDVPMYLANVREKVLRYRSHPSIALWCGRNEGTPPPAINQGIAAIMKELDPQRLYQPSSRDGRGVRSGGPYSWRTPREFYNFPASEAFKTEIGSVSIPTIEAIHAMMPVKDWETVNDDWAEHDLCRGAQEGRGLSPMFPQMIAQRYGAPLNLPDFVRKSQLANYEAYRAMYEGRFAKLFNPVTGVITWMSNPSQPSFVWQLYSHDLEPNSSLFAVRKACEPVHIQMNQNNFHIAVINSTREPLAGMEARVEVFDMDGTSKLEQRWGVTAKADAATDLGAINWPVDLSPVHFVKLKLTDAAGTVVSDNFYWRADPKQQDDFTALQKLPAAKIKVDVTRHDDKGVCHLNVALSNPTSTVALMTHLQLRRRASGERVLPVYYSDNYVSLLPGEGKKIQIEAATADFGGEEALIAVDGFNVSVEPSDGVKLDAEAQVDSVAKEGLKIAGR